MRSYYSDVLSAERLRACYDLAPQRTQQYLNAESSYVLGKLFQGITVLELGCGYGRFLKKLANKNGTFIGIDISLPSLKLANEYLAGDLNTHLFAMNAVDMGFYCHSFDLTLCIQNGISAFHVDQVTLFQEAVRVTKKGGLILFSSYAPEFWPYRMEWFEAQASDGLIGPIDYEATGNGIIVCKDGFQATTVDGLSFISLAEIVCQEARIIIIDHSSIFCEIIVR